MKWTVAAEPFVDDDTQCILVAGRAWMPLKLLRSHIGNRSSRVMTGLRTGVRSQNGYPKIAQQDLVIVRKQDILWLDVAVNQALPVSILQGVRDLPGVRDDDVKRNRRPFRVTLAQIAIGDIIHHQKRGNIFHAK